MILLLCLLALIYAFPADAAIDSSAFVHGWSPANATILSGTQVSVSLTVRNTGNTTWTRRAGYALVSLDRSWTPAVVPLADRDSIGAGEDKHFQFVLRAPIYPGKYRLQWQMSQADTSFGLPSEPVTVEVKQNPEVGLRSFYEQEIIVNREVKFSDSFDLLTVTLTGKLKDGAERVEIVHPFWDGLLDPGRTLFRFRFSPPAEGDWTWQIQSAAETGFSTPVTGAFRVDANLPTAGVCDIQVDPGNRHKLRCTDGTPFFLMGDTSWHFSTNDLAYPSPFQSYIDTRSAQKFNYMHGLVYRFSDEAPPDEKVIEVNGDNEHAFVNYDYDNPNPAYWTEVDQRVAYMNTPGGAPGLIVGLGSGWGNQLNCFDPCTADCHSFTCNNHPFANGNQLTNYVKWLVRRYRAYRVVFLPGVNVLPSQNNPCAGIDSWGDLGRAAACEDDPDGECVVDVHPQHLFTIHTQDSASSWRWPDQDWSELTYLQASDLSTVSSAYATTNNGVFQPLINGEFLYETQDACFTCAIGLADRHFCDPNCGTAVGGCTVDPQPNSGGSCPCDPACQNPAHTDKESVRRGVWQHYLRGAYVVYGNAGTFSHLVHDATCRAEKDSVGASYMSNLFNFFNNNPYRKVLWGDPAFVPIDASSTATMRVAGIPGEQYLLYAETAGTFAQNDSSAIFEWRRYTTTSDPSLFSAWSPALSNPTPNYACDVNSIAAVPDTVVLATKSTPIRCSPDPARLAPGGATAVTCTLTRVGPCFTGDIQMLPVSGLPAGVTVQFDTPVVPAGDNDVVVTFTADSSIAPGEYPVTLLAEGSSYTASLDVTLVVQGARCETFGASLPEGWSFSPDPPAPWWKVEGTELIGTTASGGSRPRKITAFAPPDWGCSDCALETGVRLLEDRGVASQVSVLGWFESEANRVELLLKKSATPEKPDLIRLSRRVNGIKVEMAKQKVPAPGLQFLQPYRVELSYDGTKIKANVYDATGQLVVPSLILQKAAVATPLTPGRTAFRVKNTSAAFNFFTTCLECSASEITIGPASVNEGASGQTSTLSFPVTMKYGTTCVDRSFSFQTADGTATAADNDYVPASESRTIAAGSSSAANVDVTVLGDDVCEADETLTLNQTNPAMVPPASATGTILNDDSCGK